jgi:2-(1,2-epoxy-1,2-dihydrophenyl)acetyl-CoA isomerase
MTASESCVIDTGTDELLAHVEDGVATLTLNRPKQRNALTEPMFIGLAQVLRDVAGVPDVGALILTGASDAFCAGGDLQVLMGQAEGAASVLAPGRSASPETRVRGLQRLQRDVALALYELAIPTIAALPGAAAGAGLSLALACDLRIASDRAIAMTAFARAGLSGDFGGSWLLAQIVGSARAKELYFLSERLDAATCERLGIVNRVVPHAALSAEAQALARRLASGPRVALAHMKANLNRAFAQDFATCLDAEAVAMRRTQGTEDHREAAHAFFEKREPRFRGR